MKKLIALSIFLCNILSYSMDNNQANISQQLNAQPLIIPQQFVIQAMALQIANNRNELPARRDPKPVYPAFPQQKFQSKYVRKQQNKTIHEPGTKKRSSHKKKK